MSDGRRPDEVIVEGVMTTLGKEVSDRSLPQRWNIAPMGPIVGSDWARLRLRPFKGSVTYHNLVRTGQGVFHVTDDVLLIARTAVGLVPMLPQDAWRPAEAVEGVVLTGACRYYELVVESLDDRGERATVEARVVAEGRLRDFLGFNRARHAVVEAAILATRLMLTGPQPILDAFMRFDQIVNKTGGGSERQAMAELRRYVEEAEGPPSGA